MIQQLSLFGGSVFDAPKTEGIKYIGSKLKLIPYILQLANKVEAKTVLDGFSGSSRVSQAFAKSGYQVIANDIAVWSDIFARCYLLNAKDKRHYRSLFDHLNSVTPKDGWFTEHYGGEANNGTAVQLDSLKKPWQIHNTRKLDAIREEIDSLSLEPIEEAVALTGLILALDKVDNTLGHFAAYLNEWSTRSYDQLFMKVPDIAIPETNHRVFCNDIFDLLPQISVDLAYFDPPYGSNNEKMPPSRVRYAAYYHVWTSVCLFDRPELFGKARRRTDSADTTSPSVFEEFRKDAKGRSIAVKAVERLIEETQARWIILSYSSGGRATADELNEVMHNNGRVLEALSIDYKRNVMSEMRWTNEWVREAKQPNTEFLFLLEK